MTTGVVFRPQSPPEQLRAAVEAAEAAGVDELWLWEDCFLEGGLTTAAAALAWSERITVGIGLLPVPFRNPALAAMELATLARLFPGRLTVALGHGVQDWMRQVGAAVDSPMTLLREHTTAVRALLAGETVDVRGRYVALDKVTLDWPPAAAAQAAHRCARPEDRRARRRDQRRRAARHDHRPRRRTPRAGDGRRRARRGVHADRAGRPPDATPGLGGRARVRPAPTR